MQAVLQHAGGTAALKASGNSVLLADSQYYSAVGRQAVLQRCRQVILQYCRQGVLQCCRQVALLRCWKAVLQR